MHEANLQRCMQCSLCKTNVVNELTNQTNLARIPQSNLHQPLIIPSNFASCQTSGV
jgi:hypothetical protein